MLPRHDEIGEQQVDSRAVLQNLHRLFRVQHDARAIADLLKHRLRDFRHFDAVVEDQDHFVARLFDRLRCGRTMLRIAFHSREIQPQRGANAWFRIQIHLYCCVRRSIDRS
jgi:hypothetical protein